MLTVSGAVDQQVRQANTVGDSRTSQVVDRAVEQTFTKILTGSGFSIILIITLEQVVDSGQDTEHRQTLHPSHHASGGIDANDLAHGGFTDFLVLRLHGFTGRLEHHVVHGNTVPLVHEHDLAN